MAIMQEHLIITHQYIKQFAYKEKNMKLDTIKFLTECRLNVVRKKFENQEIDVKEYIKQLSEITVMLVEKIKEPHELKKVIDMFTMKEMLMMADKAIEYGD
jgi:hypothetical protein